MLDLKFVRENPDIVKKNIKDKFQDQKLPLVDEVIALDAEKRSTQQEADKLRAERNKLSKQIGALMGQGKKEEAEEVKKQVAADAARLEELSVKEKELDEKVCLLERMIRIMWRLLNMGNRWFRILKSRIIQKLWSAFRELTLTVQEEWQETVSTI